MSTDLRGQLADLADHAPQTAYGAGIEDMWRRGRRRRRRERGARLVSLAVTLLCLGSLVGLAAVGRNGSMEPTDAPVTHGLPDRQWSPSPWLPGTSRSPLGRLAAIFTAERSTASGLSESSTGGVIGVSTRGSYAFLDLPGAAYEASMSGGLSASLSPDGDRVAYWVAGPVVYAGSTHTDVVGLGLYDPSTGQHWIHRVAAPRGLIAEGIGWVGDQVWFGYAPYATRTIEGDTIGGALGSTHVVRASVRDLAVFGEAAGPQLNGTLSGSAGFVTAPDGLGQASPRWVRSATADPVTLHPSRRLRTSTMSPDGHLLAGLLAGSRDDDEPAVASGLVVGRLAADGRARLHRVGDVAAVAVLGWRDADHVVVQSADGRLLAVDVTSGTTARLVDARSQAGSQSQAQFAASALAGPVVPGRAPPHPGDPVHRLVLAIWLGLGALAGLITYVVMWIGERRVRA